MSCEFDSECPTCDQAAAVIMEASLEPGWGMYVWLATTTGVSQDQLCGLRWDQIDLDSGVLTIEPGAEQIGLDSRSITLLRAYLGHCAAQAVILDIERELNSFVFSTSPDGRTAPECAAASRRYAEMCGRLGWELSLDRPGRYTADELVVAGVDIRTFTWRLQRGLSRVQRRPKRTPHGATA